MEELLDIPLVVHAVNDQCTTFTLNHKRVKPHQESLARKFQDTIFDANDVGLRVHDLPPGSIRLHGSGRKWFVSMSMEDFAHIVQVLSFNPPTP